MVARFSQYDPARNLVGWLPARILSRNLETKWQLPCSYPLAAHPQRGKQALQPFPGTVRTVPFDQADSKTLPRPGEMLDTAHKPIKVVSGILDGRQNKDLGQHA